MLNLYNKLLDLKDYFINIYTQHAKYQDVSVYYRLVITDPGTRQSVVKHFDTIKEAIDSVPDYRFDTCFEYMLFKIDSSKSEESFINLNIFKNGINLNRRLQEEHKNRKDVSLV
jgi:hypothetical protein